MIPSKCIHPKKCPQLDAVHHECGFWICRLDVEKLQDRIIAYKNLNDMLREENDRLKEELKKFRSE